MFTKRKVYFLKRKSISITKPLYTAGNAAFEQSVLPCSAVCFLGSLLFLLALTGTALSAQDYRGVLYGQVADKTGGVIPGAVVTAIGPAQTYTSKTTGKGEFSIPFVQPGQYTVSVEAPGFKKETQDNVFLDIAQKSNLSFTLQPGGMNETVTVEADAAGLNAGDASGGTVIDPEKVQNLPLNGR